MELRKENPNIKIYTFQENIHNTLTELNIENIKLPDLNSKIDLKSTISFIEKINET